MGAMAEKVANAAELKEAFKRAKASEKTYVIVMDVDPYEGWTTEGHVGGKLEPTRYNQSKS